jgi:hypothetical protein
LSIENAVGRKDPVVKLMHDKVAEDIIHRRLKPGDHDVIDKGVAEEQGRLERTRA